MGRPRTGSAWLAEQPDGTKRWTIQATRPDSTRTKPIVLPPGTSEKTARAEAKRLSALVARGDLERVGGDAAALVGETVAEWWKRYHEAAESGIVGKKNRGRPQVTVDDRRDRFRVHIEPTIGPERMASVAPPAIHRVVSKLNDEVQRRGRFYELPPEERPAGQKPGMAAKTAAHVWSELRSGFREASTLGRLPGLKVRDDDPTSSVAPPIGGDEREQAALYPSELLALLSCEDAPIWRRELYAVASYTGLRQAELRALTCADVDLEHAILRVTKQQKANGAAPTRTKTRAGVREVPIGATIAPLIARLVEGRRPADHVLRVPNVYDCADKLRVDMFAAKLTRAELVADDAHRKPFDFHGLRHTCLTHWAMATGSSVWSLAAAGHTDLATSQRYIASANLLRAGKFGTPHPPLPAALGAGVSLGISLGGERNQSQVSEVTEEKVAIPAGIECEQIAEITRVSAEIAKPATGYSYAADPRNSAKSSLPSETPSDTQAKPGDVEAALVDALSRAAAAGRFDVVAQLARELEARRLAASPNVVALDTAPPDHKGQLGAALPQAGAERSRRS